MKINKTELKYFIITIFFITFALAFDDKKPEFVLNLWLTNFLIIAIFVTMTVLVHYVGHVLIAKKYKANIEHSIWKMSYFYVTHFFSTRIHKPIAMGIIVSLFITFASLGKLFFIAIESFKLKESKHKRIGFRYIDITDYEMALIAAGGPLANLIFALFLKLINIPYLNSLILINLYYGLFHMIPFSELDGTKILFGSFPLYVFSLFLILSSLLLIYIYSLTAIIILSLFIATVFTIIFFIAIYKRYL